MGSSAKRVTFTLFRGAPRGGDAGMVTSSSKDGNKGAFMGVMLANSFTRAELDRESRRLCMPVSFAKPSFSTLLVALYELGFSRTRNAKVSTFPKRDRSEPLPSSVVD